MTNPDDDTPDAWLRSALRHAPDARIEPPAHVDQAILRAAREAVAPARSSLLAALRAAWDALARPPVAATFASLMVATVIGLMWVERPELEEAAAPKIERPAAAVATPRSDAPPPAASQAAPEPAPVPSSTPTAKAERRAAPPAAKPAPAQPAQDAAATAAGAAIAEQAAAAREAELTARQRAEAEKLADKLPDKRAADQAARQAARPAAVAAAPAAMAPYSSLLAAWRDAIAREPARWQWSIGDGAPQPANDTLSSWLQELDHAARGAWRAVPAESPSAAPMLRIWLDGQPAGTVALDAQRALLTRGARTEQADLPAADAAALSAFLKASR